MYMHYWSDWEGKSKWELDSHLKVWEGSADLWQDDNFLSVGNSHEMVSFFKNRGSNVIHSALKMSSAFEENNWLIHISAYLCHLHLVITQIQRSVLTNPRHLATGGGCLGSQLIPASHFKVQCYFSDGQDYTWRQFYDTNTIFSLWK